LRKDGTHGRIHFFVSTGHGLKVGAAVIEKWKAANVERQKTSRQPFEVPATAEVVPELVAVDIDVGVAMPEEFGMAAASHDNARVFFVVDFRSAEGVCSFVTKATVDRAFDLWRNSRTARSESASVTAASRRRVSATRWVSTTD
jgi:hypothetical protein